jgi:hypothetical protein
MKNIDKLLAGLVEEEKSLTPYWSKAPVRSRKGTYQQKSKGYTFVAVFFSS